MQKIQNRYEFDPKLDELGRGGFGRVFKAYDTLLKRDVVLKFAEKGNLPERYSLVKEISRVIDLNHRNLTRYYDAIVLPSQNQFGEPVEYQIGVMEYVSGGSLKDYIKADKQLKADALKGIVIGILRGLGYLHRKGIIHRDIKPANVLLQNEAGHLIPKLCDFGISKAAGSEVTLSKVIGTFEYMSPEQLGSDASGKITPASDLWSLGVMMYEIFTGSLPFGSRKGGDSDAIIMGNILAEQDPPRLDVIPEPYRAVVAACLVKDPKMRAQDAKSLLALLEKYRPVAPPPPKAKAPAPPKAPVPPAKTQVSSPKAPKKELPTVQGKASPALPTPPPTPTPPRPGLLKRFWWVPLVILIPALTWVGLQYWDQQPQRRTYSAQQLLERVQELNPDVRGLEIVVEDGKVIVMGEAASAAESAAVERALNRLPDIGVVENHLSLRQAESAEDTALTEPLARQASPDSVSPETQRPSEGFIRRKNVNVRARPKDGAILGKLSQTRVEILDFQSMPSDNNEYICKQRTAFYDLNHRLKVYLNRGKKVVVTRSQPIRNRYLVSYDNEDGRHFEGYIAVKDLEPLGDIWYRIRADKLEGWVYSGLVELPK